MRGCLMHVSLPRLEYRMRWLWMEGDTAGVEKRERERQTRYFMFCFDH